MSLADQPWMASSSLRLLLNSPPILVQLTIAPRLLLGYRRD